MRPATQDSSAACGTRTSVSKPFNTLCSIVERHDALAWADPILRRAWLFLIDWTDLVKQQATLSLDFPKALDSSVLPTGDVCLAWTDEVVLLRDTAPEQRDWTQPREFLLLIRQPEPRDRFDETEEHKRAWFLAQGEASFADGGADIKYTYDFFEERTLKHQPRLPRNEEIEEVVSRTMVQALAALEYINSPSRFVVEEASTARVKARRSKKIPRSNQRSSYTALRRSEVRRLFLGREEDREHSARRSPRAHWRRRHYRTLKSSFFKEKRGIRLVVPATWVGPTEVAKGGKHYRVMLDA